MPVFRISRTWSPIGGWRYEVRERRGLWPFRRWDFLGAEPSLAHAEERAARRVYGKSMVEGGTCIVGPETVREFRLDG